MTRSKAAQAVTAAQREIEEAAARGENIIDLLEQTSDAETIDAGTWSHVNRSVGAPTKYQPHYAPQAYKLCLLGHTDKELASFFHVNVETIKTWRRDVPIFAISITRE